MAAGFFGKRLRELRDAAGLSQAALAKAAGIGLKTVCQYEYGQREPGFSKLVALARGLGVSLAAFDVPTTGKRMRRDLKGPGDKT